jgi:hypothetical protein
MKGNVRIFSCWCGITDFVVEVNVDSVRSAEGFGEE